MLIEFVCEHDQHPLRQPLPGLLLLFACCCRGTCRKGNGKHQHATSHSGRLIATLVHSLSLCDFVYVGGLNSLFFCALCCGPP